jgi:hypothetical protein
MRSGFLAQTGRTRVVSLGLAGAVATCLVGGAAYWNDGRAADAETPPAATITAVRGTKGRSLAVGTAPLKPGDVVAVLPRVNGYCQANDDGVDMSVAKGRGVSVTLEVDDACRLVVASIVNGASADFTSQSEPPGGRSVPSREVP